MSLTKWAPPSAEPVVSRDADEEAWKAARRECIGASEAPIILGLVPYCTPAELWERKVFDVELESSIDMNLGLFLEPFIAQQYAEETGRTVEESQIMYRSREIPWLSCTPDAFVVLPDEPDRIGNCQWKWSGVPKFDDGIPKDFYAQLQHEMFVLGTEWASAGILMRGFRTEFLWGDCERNDEFIEAMMAQEQAFRDCVESQEFDPSLLDGSSRCKQILNRLFPDPPAESVVSLPGELIEVDAEIMEEKEAIEVLTRGLEKHQNEIRLAIGNHERGVLPNGVEWTWKPNKNGTRVLRRKG